MADSAVAVSSRLLRSQFSWRERAFPYLLMVPAVLVFCAVFVYPLIGGFRASLNHYAYGRAVGGAGLSNYSTVLHDPVFRSAMWATLVFTVLCVSIETVLGMCLALFCASERPFIRIIRTTLIVPMVVMPVVVGIVFRLVFASDAGFLSVLSRALGGSSIEVLTSQWRSFAAIVIMDVWEWTPLVFLILLAGIQSLPVEPFEAARVDGASGWRVFWDHTLPLLRPVLAVAIVLRAIDAFGTFDSVFVLTQGGPGTSTQLISLYGYKTAFKFLQTGWGAAMMFMVFVVVLAAALFAVRVVRGGAEAAA